MRRGVLGAYFCLREGASQLLLHELCGEMERYMKVYSTKSGEFERRRMEYFGGGGINRCCCF
jgi:hypothetical protein